MRIPGIIKVFWLVILFVSCNKEDVYTPVHASVLDNGVLISVVDSFGNDLLTDNDFIKQINIRGENSKKDLPFTIVRNVYEGKERYYLSFNANLPDAKQMKFVADDEAKGVTSVKVNIGVKSLKFLVTYRLTVSNNQIYGGSRIYIEEVALNDIKMHRSENTLLNSDFVINIESNNGIFKLKD